MPGIDDSAERASSAFVGREHAPLVAGGAACSSQGSLLAPPGGDGFSRHETHDAERLRTPHERAPDQP